MPAPADTLAQAVAYHRAGQLTEAVRHYELVLSEYAGHAEFRYLLGAAYQAVGQPDLAVAHLSQAIQQRPEHADSYHSLGVALAQLGKLDQAITALAQAVQLRPDPQIADTLRSVAAARDEAQGHALAAQGQAVEAEACFRRVLATLPDYAEAHSSLGAVLEQQGRLDEAAAACRRAIELKPDLGDAHYNLGVIAARQGDLHEAEARYRRALELRPELVPALNNLGRVLTTLDKLDEAAECYRRAVAYHPDFAEAHRGLGTVRLKQEKFGEAVTHFRQVMTLRPELAEAHNEYALALSKQGDFEPAIASWQRALELKGDFAAAHYNLALALKAQHRWDEALAACRRMLELSPESADGHFSYACLLLTLGRYAEGWPEYDWRWQQRGEVEPSPPELRWRGEDLAGRKLLIRSEQGLGDTIFFLRYADLLSRQGAHVTVEVPRPLVPLLEQSGYNVVAAGSPPVDFDLHIPLLSLPGVLGTTVDTVPNNVPYVAAVPKLIEHWRKELGAEDALRVGIAWQGKPGIAYDRLRSIPLAEFAPLAERGVELISLQKGLGSAQLLEVDGKFRVRDLGSAVDETAGPFMDTAAILLNLDLVICCDSAIAHLAGALGVPVWLALPFDAHWFWMVERGDTPWYPTMRLFRQRSPGDWAGVFATMAEALQSLPKRVLPG